MSVIIKTENNKYKIICKGADNKVGERLNMIKR